MVDPGTTLGRLLLFGAFLINYRNTLPSATGTSALALVGHDSRFGRWPDCTYIQFIEGVTAERTRT